LDIIRYSIRVPYNHSHIISYHIVDLKRQNRLKVGTNKPKLKVKMQSVSDVIIVKRVIHNGPLYLSITPKFYTKP